MSRSGEAARRSILIPNSTYLQLSKLVEKKRYRKISDTGITTIEDDSKNTILTASYHYTSEGLVINLSTHLTGRYFRLILYQDETYNRDIQRLFDFRSRNIVYLDTISDRDTKQNMLIKYKQLDYYKLFQICLFSPREEYHNAKIGLPHADPKLFENESNAMYLLLYCIARKDDDDA